jgi:colicin import membrane protein
MGASYNKRRYAADPEFRRGMIDASVRYQRRQAAEEPERAAEVRQRRAERARERYQTDPAYREACMAKQARYKAKAKAEAEANAKAKAKAKAETDASRAASPTHQPDTPAGDHSII